jgi:hypothetical protein
MNVIASGNGLRHLDLLLEFLAAWENRPVYLTPMAYQWCSAISEVAGRLGVGQVPVNPPPNLPKLGSQLLSELRPHLQPKPEHEPLPQPMFPWPKEDLFGPSIYPRLRPQDLIHSEFSSRLAEEEFSHVGLGCDPVHKGETSHHTCKCLPNLIPLHRVVLLPIILDVGFHLAGPGHESTLHLNHTSHHKWAFEVAFSSNNDEVLADAVNVWIVDSDQTPPGPFVSYFAKRVESSRPFSPRLRQVVIHAIESIWYRDPEVLELEAVCLLNHLNVGVDDMVEKWAWGLLLAAVVCLPTGPESLSPHYWHLLGESALGTNFYNTPGLQSLEVMRSLEEAEDWEKLEVWMVVVWQSLPQSMPAPTMEDIERVTRKLLLQRPSALQRFNNLCKQGLLPSLHWVQLRQVLDQAQMEQLPLESLPPP